ncbi:MBL fold metallo-hydrolase [Actinomadura sp. WMMB 499]|uniref:MBL fold metallo-hydrolase n=1 Tax=Actinomadura sp. WMMB 499 TaxID=1219491 RepID=UPI001247ACD8|nr:ribonuclease Z [Actinomadura sp. WMMB 499]QFG25265.1 ribonuclease Z [Actinomadura sp. WMMB 499]
MRLQFIGTGSILSASMSASALVDGKVLVDAPNGSLKAMRGHGLDPLDIDVCLITHFHADHFFDIVFLFLEQGLRHARDRELVLIGPSGFEERLERLFEMAYPDTYAGIREKVPPRFVEIGDQGGEWSGDGYRIHAMPVDHTVPALGYAIADESGARLGYTGDTVLCPAVEKLAADCPTVVLDTSFPAEGKFGHMGLADVEPLADRHPDVRFLATHRDDDVTRSSRTNIVFPEDGQAFEIDGAATPAGPGAP